MPFDQTSMLLQEVLSWLQPCLSVDPASRPSVHKILQQPFFLRLAALEYLQAVAQEEAAAQLAAGEPVSASPTMPPWLLHAQSPGAAGGPGRLSGASSSSDGLPALTPRVEPYVSPPHRLGDSQEVLYPHLDPEVVAELTRLNIVRRDSV